MKNRRNKTEDFIQEMDQNDKIKSKITEFQKMNKLK